MFEAAGKVTKLESITYFYSGEFFKLIRLFNDILTINITINILNILIIIKRRFVYKFFI